jgi:hypothetical protein
MKIPNNEIINNFWNNIPLSFISPDEITNMIKKLDVKTEKKTETETNNNTKENFLNGLEKIIFEVFFNSNINKTSDTYADNNTNKEVMEYLKKKYFSILIPKNILMVFFCIYLLSNGISEHNFRENFLRFYEICKKNMDFDPFILKLNDINLIKEFVIFYVYLISIGTIKGFDYINNKNKIEYCYKDLENNFTQNNRDLLIEDLFFIFDKIQFNFNSFFIHNFYRLHNEKVRHSLKEIEMRNNIIENQNENHNLKDNNTDK